MFCREAVQGSSKNWAWQMDFALNRSSFIKETAGLNKSFNLL